MELSELRLFASIVQTLNFSKTAELFYISQPAVSAKMKQLEHELGVKLIQRNSHQVSITPDGMEFMEYVSKILELVDQAEVRMKNLSEGRTGRIKIAALPSSSQELTKCLTLFCRQYPLIQTDIDILEGSELTKAIEQHTHHIYFATDKMLPPGNVFDYIFLSKFQLHLYLPKPILSEFDNNNWTSISHLPFISVLRNDRALYSDAKKICHNRGIKQKIINYFNRADAILTSVSAGAGIAILPASFKDSAEKMNVAAIPIEGADATVTSVLAWNSDNISLTTERFIDIAHSLFEQ